MASSRHQVLIRSEVARWKALEPPYGASQEEIEACRARRADYTERITAGVAMLVKRDGFLSTLGRVLGRVSSSAPSRGVPEVSTIVRQVHDELDAEKAKAAPDEAPPCARCTDDGGITLFGNRHPVQRAVPPETLVTTDAAGKVMHHGPSRPLCAWHVELAAWEAYGAVASRPYPRPAWAAPAGPSPREPGDDTDETAAVIP